MRVCLCRTGLGAVALKFIWILLSLIGLATSVTRAQTADDGAIAGSVVDPGGASVIGALVEIRNSATGLHSRVVTDVSGHFFALRLSPGEYELIVASPGFVPTTTRHIVVEVGAVTTVPVHLRLAGESATISVTDRDESSPTLESTSSALSTVIGAVEVDLLPMNSPRWQSFALLTPAANPSSEDDGLLSFRGLPVTQNSTSIDGANDDQSYNATPRGVDTETIEEGSDERERGSNDVGMGAGSRRHSGTAYTFSQLAVREFRISTQNETALYGQGGEASSPRSQRAERTICTVQPSTPRAIAHGQPRIHSRSRPGTTTAR
jgi:carboxypeptidase family protein